MEKIILPTFRLQELSLEMFSKDLQDLDYDQRYKVKEMFLAELFNANKPITIKTF
tara:strand:- start:672 stop:836 length:165 start_codon:yes stop_codon:yes gene_type:complete